MVILSLVLFLGMLVSWIVLPGALEASEVAEPVGRPATEMVS